MTVPIRNLNTAFSYGFRSAVALHFASLFVLIFMLEDTLVGFRHHVVAVALSILMAVVAVLFMADMVTQKAEGREQAKVIDVILACTWFALVGYLVINSLRAGEIMRR
jgi:uncharacterized membrane protein